MLQSYTNLQVGCAPKNKNKNNYEWKETETEWNWSEKWSESTFKTSVKAKRSCFSVKRSELGCFKGDSSGRYQIQKCFLY